MTFPAREDFIATADSRNTAPEVMEAIAFYARDLSEAEAIWEGDYSNELLEAIAAYATRNNQDPADLDWGMCSLAEMMEREVVRFIFDAVKQG